MNGIFGPPLKLYLKRLKKLTKTKPYSNAIY